MFLKDSMILELLASW